MAGGVRSEGSEDGGGAVSQECLRLQKLEKAGNRSSLGASRRKTDLPSRWALAFRIEWRHFCLKSLQPPVGRALCVSALPRSQLPLASCLLGLFRPGKAPQSPLLFREFDFSKSTRQVSFFF